jgi:VWFA-related protein
VGRSLVDKLAEPCELLMTPSPSTVVNCRHGWRDGLLPRVCYLLMLFSLVVGGLAAQSESAEPAQPAGSTPQEPAADVPEMSTHEELQTFQVKVNLVEVRVVVRDAQGNPVGNLKQDDFLLFDDNKPQTIARFAVEKNDGGAAPAAVATGPQNPELGSAGTARTETVSEHRVAFLFDDVNSTAIDLAGARKATEQRINALKPGESIAIFTISGQGNQDFTSDHDRLLAALSQLKPRPIGGPGLTDCPPIDYYIAAQIERYHDERALRMVMTEVDACQFDGKARSEQVLEGLARSKVSQVMQAGETRLQLTLQSMNDIVRRVTALPGRRTIVFLSPGMYVVEEQAALTDYLNRAIRAGVVINTLDIRGLYTDSANGVDVSLRGSGTGVYPAAMSTYSAASAGAQTDAMMQIAYATGGNFFHNRNDLAAGLEKLTAVPEYSYLLGFTPQNLKNDGKFHPLLVKLKQGAGLTVQARNGYLAPRKVDAKEEAKQEITDEVFAQNEVQELPLQTHTQYYLGGDDKAHINVVVRVDVKRMAFKKSEGRNLNDLTVVTALFDRNANFISAKSNTVQMHIKDETLGRLSSGITLRSNFDVTPGSYVIRVVARDAQGKLSAQNSAIEIP